MKTVKIWSLHEVGSTPPGRSAVGFVGYAFNEADVDAFKKDRPDRLVYPREALSIGGRYYVLDRFCPAAGLSRHPPPSPGWSRVVTSGVVSKSSPESMRFWTGTTEYEVPASAVDPPGDPPPVNTAVTVVMDVRPISPLSSEYRLVAVTRAEGT